MPMTTMGVAKKNGEEAVVRLEAAVMMGVDGASKFMNVIHRGEDGGEVKKG